mmetsp:Transcript_20554/g.58427  ORF Transcript_20554/g.58427 Transcript_20554/m.58427 type:complete len:239 (-) Transcript_20554:1798-2514(-)
MDLDDIIRRADLRNLVRQDDTPLLESAVRMLLMVDASMVPFATRVLPPVAPSSSPLDLGLCIPLSSEPTAVVDFEASPSAVIPVEVAWDLLVSPSAERTTFKLSMALLEAAMLLLLLVLRERSVYALPLDTLDDDMLYSSSSSLLSSSSSSSFVCMVHSLTTLLDDSRVVLVMMERLLLGRDNPVHTLSVCLEQSSVSYASVVSSSYSPAVSSSSSSESLPSSCWPSSPPAVVWVEYV